MARTKSRRAAIASGAKTYFTGNPCKHGHTADRYTRNGMCVDCAYNASAVQREKDREAHIANADEPEDDGVPEATKIAVRQRTNHQIKIGRLLPLPCEVCGVAHEVEAHHPDYAKPDLIQWLCIRHHNEVHRLARAIQRLGYRAILKREGV